MLPLCLDNLDFLDVVKDVLGTEIPKQLFEGEIVRILDVDPDASSLIGVVKEFYFGSDLD